MLSLSVKGKATPDTLSKDKRTSLLHLNFRAVWPELSTLSCAVLFHSNASTIARMQPLLELKTWPCFRPDYGATYF